MQTAYKYVYMFQATEAIKYYNYIQTLNISMEVYPVKNCRKFDWVREIILQK